MALPRKKRMNATEIIAIVILALVVGGAIAYIIKAKKSGRKCIGCPDGCNCSGAKGEHGSCCCGNCDSESGGCNCNQDDERSHD